MSELVPRSEQDLLDIRNFGSKSIDEVKLKLPRDGSVAQGQRPRVRPAERHRYDDDADETDYSETEQY